MAGDAGIAKTISVIVPAYNEEGNLRNTVEGIEQILNGYFSEYEILIFNDCSTDHTGEIANALAERNPKIRVIHNSQNMGFGYNYVKGVEVAQKNYIMLIPGDNEISEESIGGICDRIGDADIIIPYTVNTWVRSFSRRVISRAFTNLVNLIAGLNLHYYNGPCIHRSDIIKSVQMTTFGYAYMASNLARLIKSGCNYVEIGMYLKPRKHGESKAFRIKNILRVLKTLSELFWDIRIKGIRKVY
jgi:glycosyltransferase involved in cell wall biosynthesis